MASFNSELVTNDKGIAKISSAIALTHWFAKRPNKRFKISIKEVAEAKSERMRGYYFAVIVKQYNEALRTIGYSMTKDETHDYIKQFSPIMHRTIDIPRLKGKTVSFRSLSDDDFTDADFRTYIEDLIIFAADNLDLIIDDPNTIEP
jgi:hypothetical protein